MSETQTSSNSRLTTSQLAYTLIVLIASVFILSTLQNIIVPLLFALIITVMFLPLCRKFEKLGLSRITSSILCIIIAIISVSIVLYAIVSQTIAIGQDASEITQKLHQVVDSGENWLYQQFGITKSQVITQFEEKLSEAASSIGGYFTSTLSTVGSVLGFGILIPIMSFFFMYYRAFFHDFFLKAFNNASKNEVEGTLYKMFEVLQSYMVGQGIVMLIIGTLNSLGLFVMGIEHAIFFGFLASILMLLPYIGITIGSLLPAAFAIATKDSMWYPLGVIAWFQFVQFLEGNFITPNIVGGKISLNPMFAMLSILLFGMLWGLVGFILALPMAALLKVLFDAIPATHAFGFLLGEPDEKYLKKESKIQENNEEATSSENQELE